MQVVRKCAYCVYAAGTLVMSLLKTNDLRKTRGSVQNCTCTVTESRARTRGRPRRSLSAYQCILYNYVASVIMLVQVVVSDNDWYMSVEPTTTAVVGSLADGEEGFTVCPSVFSYSKSVTLVWVLPSLSLIGTCASDGADSTSCQSGLIAHASKG